VQQENLLKKRTDSKNKAMREVKNAARLSGEDEAEHRKPYREREGRKDRLETASRLCGRGMKTIFETSTPNQNCSLEERP